MSSQDFEIVKWSLLRLPERLVLLVVVVALAGLVVWPAFVERDDVRQVEFAWEMYAKLAPAQAFTVVSDSGSTSVGLESVVATGIAEIPYEEVVPEWLCRNDPEALLVVIHFGSRQWEHVCDR